MSPDNILEIRDLKTHFFTDEGTVKAVDGVSLTIGEGESGGLVGESGSGKSMTAIAISCEPDLLICDEPTTALDVSTQAQIIDLLNELRRERRTSFLFITHDLGVLSWACTYAAVMYGGNIVEYSDIRSLVRAPKHPYTAALIGATPRLDCDRDALNSIPGSVPSLIQPPTGCKFHPRCDRAQTVCGKTTLGRTCLRLYEPTSGMIFFDGKDVCHLTSESLRKMRSRMQIIFQDPYSSLNPRMTVGKMLSQILYSHGVKDPHERQKRCVDAMEKVGLEMGHLKRFPHEFSGGQRQRIAIARALILYPSLIVADEPSSALDMSIQAQILNLMKSLQKEMGIAYIFITHNLSAARFLCDRIAVMYLGKIVELADRTKLFENPSHPYTKALLPLCPTPDPDGRIEQAPLKGEVPSPVNLPQGCRFHPRCPDVMDICSRGRSRKSWRSNPATMSPAICVALNQEAPPA